MRKQKNYYYYNFYDILRVASTSPIFPEFLLSKNKAKADVTFKERDFLFEKEDTEAYGLGYNLKSWGGGGKLYVEFKKFLITFWKLLLSDLNKKTQIFFKRYKSFTFMPQRIKAFYNVEPLVNQLILLVKLLQKDYTLVHAGCVSCDGKALLWPAMDDVGKSTTTRYFMKKGFNPISDDVVILSRKGQVYPLFSQGDVEEFVSKHLKSSEINRVYFIEKSKDTGIRRTEKETIIEKILASTSYVLVRDIPRRIYLAYCLLNNFNPFFIEEKMKQVLSKALEKCDCFLIRGTRENFGKIIEKEEGINFRI